MGSEEEVDVFESGVGESDWLNLFFRKVNVLVYE